MLEIHLQKLLTSPAFPHLYAQSLLSHIVSPHFSPLLPSSPSPSFLTSLTPPLCPSVSLIILHCFTCNVVRHWQSGFCTHTHIHTHAGRHTPTTSGSPPPFLTPLHCRHETHYNPQCASFSSTDTVWATVFCNYTQSGTEPVSKYTTNTKWNEEKIPKGKWMCSLKLMSAACLLYNPRSIIR